MNRTLFELGVALPMVAMSVSLAVWFWRYMADASERRTIQMWTRAGAASEVAKHGDVVKGVRSRCRTCQSEDYCDRWLAGKVAGDNSFCPTAQVFRGLTGAPGRHVS